MNDKEKTEVILNALIQYHTTWGRDRKNIIFPELRLGSGYSDIAMRRIDLFIISSDKGNLTTAFEIKVSRKDFLSDIKKPLKQRGARLYSNNFYYVTPKSLLTVDEIPLWAGLMEYDFEQKEKYLSFFQKVPAPLQNKANPSWGLIASLIRKIKSMEVKG